MSQIAILGRQPAIGLAELESLYGADVITPVGKHGARIEVEHSAIKPERLGGTVKLAKLLTILDTSKWPDISKYLATTLPHHLQYIPEGKIKLGISTYGIDVAPKQQSAHALELKTVLKRAGRSVRVIPNKDFDLNTAQVIHGGLLSPTGIELLIIADGSNTIIAQTHWVQDIDAYRRRDQERPKRDARVGMLPPKLAQTIVNLAVSGTVPHFGGVILDPFCGTGVVLQEATLMGYDVYGSDLDERMTKYTDENLMWLLKQPNCPIVQPPETTDDPSWRYYKLETSDATRHKWSPPPYTIACETYLGRPLSSQPDQDTLRKIMSDCDTIHRKFLQNVTRQTEPGFRMCIAVPAWHTKNGFKHLKTLDSITDLGYNRIKFVHADNKDLIYHRTDQIVSRELVVLERI